MAPRQLYLPPQLRSFFSQFFTSAQVVKMDNGSGTGTVKFESKNAFNSAKVFSATMMNDRAMLGETITEWMRANPSFVVTEIFVTQSSDEAFHCLAMTVFYYDPSADS
jgi:hypothetical protein